MAAPDVAPELLDVHLITIRWDNEEGRPICDLGGLSPWECVSILRATADQVLARVLQPRPSDEDPEE